VAGTAALVAASAVAATRDRVADVQQLLKQLQQYPAHATLAREPIAHAERALRRGADARAARDHEHAALLEQLAEEWAVTGRDLIRASDAERDASKIEQQLAEAETRRLRARALIEETVSRKQRAEQKLQDLAGAATALPRPADAGTPAGSTRPKVDGGSR
jgi:hypothetical protein